MKKSVELVGLPVYSIAEAREIGFVKSLVINPAMGSAAALVIDDGKWYLEAKLLPFSQICGLGESAIIIQSITSLITATANKEMVELLEKDILVNATKVLTNKGQVFGSVNDMIFDEVGSIHELIIEAVNGDQINLPAKNVCTYGKEVTIINAEGDSPSKPCRVKVFAQQDSIIADQKPIATTEINKQTEDTNRQYIIGKKAKRRIEADNGILIVEEGAEITEEIVQKAKLSGKYVDLSTNIK